MKHIRFVEQENDNSNFTLDPNAKPKPRRSTNSAADSAVQPAAGRNEALFRVPIALLTEKAFAEIAGGRIPNFEKLCRDLLKTIDPAQDSFSALQFLEALHQHSFRDSDAIGRLLQHPDSSHVLIHNDILKVILIRWEPSAASNLHGHSVGGCVFKVLHGTVEESRYHAADPEKMLAKNTYFPGNMAYIDDRMGHHIVRNPGEEPALTMHLYTPGNYKPRG